MSAIPEVGQLWVVKKLGYSRAPWRIIHVPSGLQISYEVPYPGASEVPMPPIQQAGFDWKRDAVAHAQTLDWDDIDRRIAEARPVVGGAEQTDPAAGGGT